MKDLNEKELKAIDGGYAKWDYWAPTGNAVADIVVAGHNGVAFIANLFCD